MFTDAIDSNYGVVTFLNEGLFSKKEEKENTDIRSLISYCEKKRVEYDAIAREQKGAKGDQYIFVAWAWQFETKLHFWMRHFVFKPAVKPSPKMEEIEGHVTKLREERKGWQDYCNKNRLKKTMSWTQRTSCMFNFEQLAKLHADNVKLLKKLKDVPDNVVGFISSSIRRFDDQLDTHREYEASRIEAYTEDAYLGL